MVDRLLSEARRFCCFSAVPSPLLLDKDDRWDDRRARRTSDAEDETLSWEGDFDRSRRLAESSALLLLLLLPLVVEDLRRLSPRVSVSAVSSVPRFPALRDLVNSSRLNFDLELDLFVR